MGVVVEVVVKVRGDEEVDGVDGDYGVDDVDDVDDVDEQ